MNKLKSWTLEQWLAIIMVFNTGVLLGIILMIGANAQPEVRVIRQDIEVQSL